MNELLTPAQMGRADALSPAHGVPSRTLMANAGLAVARAISSRFRPCRTVVLCGPGNNGGDGYVVARLLEQQGWPVAVAALGPPREGSDAAWAAADWRGPIAAFDIASVRRADLVIDAVFGAGLARDIEPEVAEALRASRRVIAVDVPSGVDGATGAVRGYAPQAVLTVTFFRYKPGHLLLPGRDLCGERVLADIGMPASVLKDVRADTFANGPALWRVPLPQASGHKYSRGDVTVLGGAKMTGAARLAAEAARRVGAGLVTIAAAQGGDIYRAGEPGTIVSDAGVADLLQDERRRVWVCGPGLGKQGVAEALPKLLAAGRSVVADADTFTAFAGQPEALRGAAVLTPHAGEFARLFGHPGEDRVAAVRAAAARVGGVVLLKGSDTIIASPDGRAVINAEAPAWLSTAGSGDVLSGIIAGLLAQGLAAFEAACAGVWLHGRCGALAGRGLIAEDLQKHLPQAITEASPDIT